MPYRPTKLSNHRVDLNVRKSGKHPIAFALVGKAPSNGWSRRRHSGNMGLEPSSDQRETGPIGLTDVPSVPDVSGEDGDCDTWIFTHPTPERLRLDPSHALASFRYELAQVAFEEFSNQSLPVGQRSLGKRGSDDAPCAQPRKRGRSPGSLDVKRETPGTTRSEKKDLRFSCPFFSRHPANHQHCLRDNLRRIIDVKRHLWAAHRRPYHCRICGTFFRTAGACDSHFREVRCKRRPLPEIEGVSEDQLERLSRASDPVISEENQWFLVWDTVFPGVARPPDSRLPSDVPSVPAVLLLREYWARHGKRVTRNFFEQGRIQRSGACWKGQDLEALRVSVLRCMIDKLLLQFDQVCDRG